MRRTLTLPMLAMTLIVSAPQHAAAQDDAEPDMFRQVRTQLADPAYAEGMPKGFQLAEVKLAASSPSERAMGVRAKLHVVFSTDGKVPSQREGFSYHIFMDPQQATSYYKLPGSQLFGSSPLWARSPSYDPVHAYTLSTPGKPELQREIRCRILSPKIVCMYHEDGSPVVVMVGLYAPALETASNDEARAAVVNKLVVAPERGAAFLFAARYHLAKALSAALSSVRGK